MLDRRRHVAPCILKHRGEVVGRVSGQRVLKVEQSEMRDSIAPLDQHDVLGMVIAKHGHRARDRRRYRFQAPRATPPVCHYVNVRSHRRTIPVA